MNTATFSNSADFSDIRSVARKSKRNRTILLLIMVLPALVHLFIFAYVPMYGIIIAFKDYNLFLGPFGSPWAKNSAGEPDIWYNFKFFLTDPTFWKVIRNTIRINLYDLAFGFSAPIIFALLMNEVMFISFKKTIQIVSYMPNFFSWVVVAGLVTSILSPNQNGLVNIVLGKLFGTQPIFFLANPNNFIPIVVSAAIWKNMGYSAILYIALLGRVDPELHEAAAIDGAGRLRRAWHVTLPALLPIISLSLIFTLASMFSIGFDRIFLLQNNLTKDVSEVIGTYTYRMGIVEAQFSKTTAIGLAQSLIGLITVYVSNYSSKKITGYGIY